MPALRDAGAFESLRTERVESLTALFSPQAVAVVGASDEPSRIGGRLLRYMREGGFAGPVHPVNPRRATVQGLPAVPTIRDVPGTPDVALLAVPAEATIEAMQQCAERGIRAAVVLSAGFAETGAEGEAAQLELAQIARSAKIRVLGPNCLGVLNSATGFYGTFANALGRGFPTPGPVAIASQSGAFGAHLLYLARRRGLGVTHWITTGNEVDVDLADAIAWMALEPEVRVIAVYAEGVRDGDRFAQALSIAAETGTTVVVMKVGSSAAGARAASSHTAALTGSDTAYDAVFERYGALRASDAEQLLDITYACALAKPTAGSRLGVVTVSGGAGVQACDAARRYGLTVPTLPRDAQQRLQELLPFAAVANPIDVTAQVLQQLDVLVAGLDALIASAAVDAVLIFLTTTPLFGAFTDPLREAIIEGTAHRAETPVAVCMIADDEEVREYERSGFLVFEDIDRAVNGLAALARLGRRQRAGRSSQSIAALPAVAPLGDEPLSELASKRLLAAAGMPVLDERLAVMVDEAVAAAGEIGYPVVLKIVSPDVQHKSEVGGVALDLRDDAAVRAAFARIQASLLEHAPDARIDGILVAPMAPDGVEVIVGCSLDPTFGPLVMIGLGGIFVEVFGDVSIRLAPVDPDEARTMIEELRGAELLRGARGQAPADIAALADAVALISRLAAAYGASLASLDVNPLLVRAAGQGVVALDASVIPARLA